MGKKEEEAQQQQEQELISYIKFPRDKEIFGIVEQRVGGSRLKVRCFDSKTRICRIPGRLKRKLWVREGDLIIVEPWELGGEEKGDVVYKYKPIQVDYLKRKGALKQMEEFEEF